MEGNDYLMQSEVISDARKVLGNLLDEKSFVEILENYDLGVICGYGTINLRPVCVFAQEHTVDNGAVNEKNCEKICKIIDMAMQNGIPIIGIYDSMGVKIDESSRVFLGIRKMLDKMALASGVVPQISVVLGSAVGVASFAVNFSDFVVMIDKKSQMFVNGPQSIMAEEGNEVTAENLGGAMVHSEKSGMCDVIVASIEECTKKVKELLDYLPDNNLADVYVTDSDDLNRECDELDNGIENNREVVFAISDENKFYEIKAEFEKSVITGFSRIGGRVSGIVANVQRTLNAKSIEKIIKFVRFCDAFNIPIVTLVDVEGTKISTDEEMNGISSKLARLIYSYSDATVPKIDIIIGNMFGGASTAMGASPDITLAWDSAKISVALPKVAVNVIYSNEISEAEEPVKYREEKLSEYLENEAIPEKAEETSFIDGVIRPSETRKRIINALELYISKREIKINKKHSSMPF